MADVATVDELFDRQYAAIVRALAVAFDDAEGAAEAVQEAFIEADRRWRTVGQYDEPAVWIRRVAINRLRNGRRNRLRRSEIVAAIRRSRPRTSPTRCSTCAGPSTASPRTCAWPSACTMWPGARSTRWPPRSR